MKIQEIEVKSVMTRSVPPVVVNYFFHEEIIPSARKEQLRKTRICC